MSMLAINGGLAVRKLPFPPWPTFSYDEIEAAVAVLKSGRVNYWTGEECEAFEREFAAACGRRFGISLANGTVALELALRSLGIGAGDEVIVPSRTFIATASCVVACGAKPILADVDPVTGNMTSSSVAAVVTANTRAIIAVHMGGWPCDMDSLLALAEGKRLQVVEDCAQAHGATYKGRPVGSFGAFSSFSFCQDKILTTGGEGGMLLTDDEAMWRRAWEYKDHGKNWTLTRTRESSTRFRWLHESFGTNWRMTEMQAALGRRQLTKLPEWVAKRRDNALRLAEGLAGIAGLSVPKPGPEFGHAWYKFYARVDHDSLRPGWDTSRVIDAVNAEGIPCMTGSCAEIYRERAFLDAGLAPTNPLPGAASWSKSGLMLLVHPTLTPTDMDDAVIALRKVMDAAT